MRPEVVKVFARLVPPALPANPRVALVGGSSMDPELAQLPAGAQISFFGIDNPIDDANFTYLDINVPQSEGLQKFDLVLCSQVLEHVWDIKTALANLGDLLEVGGLLWVAFPASNFAHGSPDYFAAGFTPTLVEKLGEQMQLSTVDSGFIGSQRNYVWTHAYQQWPTPDELAHPVLGSMRTQLHQPGSAAKRLVKTAMQIRKFPLLFQDKSLRTDVKYATESWVLARRDSQ